MNYCRNRYASIQRDFEEEKRFYCRHLPKKELWYALLEEEAETAILHGIGHFKKDRKNKIFGGKQVNLNVGIGTELLLKAIIVKNNGYILHETDKSKTIDFEKCISRLKKILRKDKRFDKKVIGRIEYVLRIIKLRRDNIAHSSISHASSYRTPPQIFGVLGFLMRKYFGKCKLALKLRRLAKKERVPSKFPENDYEPIDFDKYL